MYGSESPVLTKHLIIVYSACPGLHTLAPKQAVVSQDTCQWQLLPDIQPRKKQQNLPGPPKRCQCPGTLQKGALVLRPSSPPYPTHLGCQAQSSRRIRITIWFPVTWHLKTALFQNRCLAFRLRVATVQHVSSAVRSRTIYSQGFCPSAEKLLYKLPIGAALFDPNCLYTSNKGKSPPCYPKSPSDILDASSCTTVSLSCNYKSE